MKMDFFSKNSRYGTGNHRIAVELDLSYWGWGGVGGEGAVITFWKESSLATLKGTLDFDAEN